MYFIEAELQVGQLQHYCSTVDFNFLGKL